MYRSAMLTAALRPILGFGVQAEAGAQRARDRRVLVGVDVHDGFRLEHRQPAIHLVELARATRGGCRDGSRAASVPPTGSTSRTPFDWR